MKPNQRLALALIVVACQFTPVAVIAVIAGALLVFWEVAFAKELRLLNIFTLLAPSMLFRDALELAELFVRAEIRDTPLSFITSRVRSVYLIGPLAFSAKLTAALAVPLRISLTFRSQLNPYVVLFWGITVLLSIVALYNAVSMELVSAGGLTIGFRSALSVGALLFPLSIRRCDAEKSIRIICLISLFLLTLNDITNHWVFVAIAFPALVTKADASLVLKFCGVLALIAVMVYDRTFTMLFTLVMSFAFVYSPLLSVGKSIVFNRISVFLFAIFPIVVVTAVLGSLVDNILSLVGNQKFQEKLIGDRGRIWKFSWDFVADSDPFFVTAGRNIPTFNYTTKGYVEWGAGAHNIYLEMARQNGLFCSLLTFALILVMFLQYLPRCMSAKEDYVSGFVLASIAVYMVFGLTGQSLVYDGVGFFFWLTFGQLVKLLAWESTNESTSYFGRV